MPLDKYDKPGNDNRTVMIYMAADNSLAEESVWALTEILEIESQLVGSGVKVEVLFDSNAKGMRTKVHSLPRTTNPNTASNGQESKIGGLRTSGRDFSFPIGSPASTKPLTSLSSSRDGEEENASDRRLLIHFLTEILAAHKHNPQLLILSGHGSGAIGDFLSGRRAKEAITITGLGNTLRKVKKELRINFDIIGMDSCLMSMAEVAYELRNCANILIGSEGFEPETGWPYKEIIPEVTSEGNSTELARKIVNKYIKYYADYVVAGTSVDLSACNLSEANALANSLRKLSKILQQKFGVVEQKVVVDQKVVDQKVIDQKLIDQKVVDAVLLAHWRAQSYKNEQYVDLWDFCHLLEEGCEDDKVKRACQDVRDVIDGKGKYKRESRFVIFSKYYGAAFQHSHGVSIYFPWRESPALDEYQKLSFAKNTKWGEFLKAYVEVTQRKMRGEPRSGAERVDITPAERPLVIPLQDGAPAGAQTPSIAGRFPPDNGKGMLLGRDVMKNPPTSFLINKVSGEAITDEGALSLAAANRA